MTSTAELLLLLLSSSGGAPVSPYTFDVTSFTQALGAEQLANGDFATDTVWVKAGTWAITGGHAVHTTDGGTIISQNVLTPSTLYYITLDWTVSAPCFELIRLSGANMNPVMTTSGAKRRIGRTTNDGLGTFFDFFSCGDNTLDNASVKPLTTNAVQTATVSADERAAFTLPASPIPGQKFDIWYRMPSGIPYLDGWQVTMVRNPANTLWEISLIKCISGLFTTIIAPVNAGTPNAIKVLTSGDNHSVYYSSGGIDGAFTQAGTTQTDAQFDTATGSVLVYDPAFTVAEHRSLPN